MGTKSIVTASDLLKETEKNTATVGKSFSGPIQQIHQHSIKKLFYVFLYLFSSTPVQCLIKPIESFYMFISLQAK